MMMEMEIYIYQAPFPDNDHSLQGLALTHDLATYSHSQNYRWADGQVMWAKSQRNGTCDKRIDGSQPILIHCHDNTQYTCILNIPKSHTVLVGIEKIFSAAKDYFF